MNRFTRFVTASCAALSILSAAEAQDYALGTWHGTLESPGGPLTIVFVVSENDQGELTSHMESPDQAPGAEIPVSDINAKDGELTILINAIGATYQATWDKSAERWDGTYTQGIEMNLDLERGRPDARPVIKGLDGLWRATVTRNDIDLRLILRVQTGEAGTIATLDSPDQGAHALPVSSLARSQDAVAFSIPAVGAEYEAIITGEDRLSGIWSLPTGEQHEVTFERTNESLERSARNRPQHPEKPYPYHAEDVTFNNAEAQGVTLAGTLTIPDGKGPFPAAVLISGSGPQDRNEEIFDHKPFLVIADHLTRNGVAVLRYDDRGVGQSTGDHNGATSADFATDANAAFQYLRTRDEIDPDAIGLIGHSEGGMIGPIAAANNGDIAYLVLLAGPGTNTKHLLLTQSRLVALSQGAPEELVERQAPVMSRLMSVHEDAPTPEDARNRIENILTPEAMQAMGVPESQKSVLIASFMSPWMRYFLRYDPDEYLQRIGVPVLAINGALDLQVPPDENLDAIEDALSHNPDVTIMKLEGLNHLFQEAESGSIGEYAEIEQTFSPRALRIVSEWINTRFTN